jgi:hypothetical protein
MSTNDGGPAFPCPASSIGADGSFACLTVRDWFAGQAMVRMRGPYDDSIPDVTAYAARCYALADAMLAERAK